MSPLLEGRRLSDIIFEDPDAEEQLRRTEITQPAVLTVDIALTRLLAEYGFAPDMVMGHSLGEYGALVAAGSLTFEAALEAVSARGREMAGLQPEDPGAMAAVMAPLAEVEEVVASIDGYVVLANVNSTSQVVLGGATEAVGRAVAALKERGHDAFPLPVSHAFHTEIVAAAGVPLRATLQRLGVKPPQLPIVANVDGELYPATARRRCWTCSRARSPRPCSSSRACAPSTTTARASSSRSARSAPSRGSHPTCSATTRC